MLAIRLQRTGRKGHAQFRMIVQESRRTPTSGKWVALLGQYNPHAKTATLDLEKANFYLKHGAQPSDRVARLLKKEGIKLPKWVQLAPDKNRSIRHPEKLRANRPAEETPSAKATEDGEEATIPEADTTESSAGADAETSDTSAAETQTESAAADENAGSAAVDSEETKTAE